MFIKRSFCSAWREMFNIYLNHCCKEWLACIAWRFLGNLRVLGKQGSHGKAHQSREEPGRDCFEPHFVAGFLFDSLHPGAHH